MSESVCMNGLVLMCIKISVWHERANRTGIGEGGTSAINHIQLVSPDALFCSMLLEN